MKLYMYLVFVELNSKVVMIYEACFEFIVSILVGEHSTIFYILLHDNIALLNYSTKYMYIQKLVFNSQMTT